MVISGPKYGKNLTHYTGCAAIISEKSLLFLALLGTRGTDVFFFLFPSFMFIYLFIFTEVFWTLFGDCFLTLKLLSGQCHNCLSSGVSPGAQGVKSNIFTQA